MRRFVIHFGDGFAHGLPLEFEAVGVMDDAIEDGICEGRVAEFQIRVAVMNGFTALGIPVTETVG